MDMKLFYGLSYNPFQKDVTDTTVETIDFKEEPNNCPTRKCRDFL